MKAKADAVVPSVQVLTVERETIPAIIPATGELLAEDQATLRTKVAGRIEKLAVDLGSRVEANQVIAELEKIDYELRLRQAEAALQQARARLGLGPGDSDDIDPANTAVVRQAAASLREATLMQANAAELFKQGVVSNVDFQRAGVALQAAQARHQGAVEEVYRSKAEILQRRSELALARQQLADTVIRAPFSGGITERIATVGEYLAVNAPVAVLVRSHPLRIRLQVPEREAHRVRAGQRIDLKIEGQQAPRPGRVVRLSPAIESQNRSLIVEGEIPNEDGRLRAGAFVEASVTVDPSAQGIAVPQSAVLSFAGVERVFSVKDGVLVEHQVRLGRLLDNNRVEVQAGLHTGEQLVLRPSDRFLAGERVNVTR